MTRPSDDREGDSRRSGARRPRPVRPAAPRPPGKVRAEGGDGGSPEEAAETDASPKGRSKPTPVRDMAVVDAPPPPAEPDVEEARLEADEVEWIIRVLGRAGGGRSPATPLLLLGFWRDGSEDEDHEKEALVVGRALSEMTPAALRNALEEAGPPRPPPTGTSDAAGRGRRGRGSGRGRSRS